MPPLPTAEDSEPHEQLKAKEVVVEFSSTMGNAASWVGFESTLLHNVLWNPIWCICIYIYIYACVCAYIWNLEASGGGGAVWFASVPRVGSPNRRSKRHQSNRTPDPGAETPSLFAARCCW